MQRVSGYAVTETTDIIDAGTLANPHAELPGLKGYRVADQNFEIVDRPMIPIQRLGENP